MSILLVSNIKIFFTNFWTNFFFSFSVLIMFLYLLVFSNLIIDTHYCGLLQSKLVISKKSNLICPVSKNFKFPVDDCCWSARGYSCTKNCSNYYCSSCLNFLSFKVLEEKFRISRKVQFFQFLNFFKDLNQIIGYYEL